MKITIDDTPKPSFPALYLNTRTGSVWIALGAEGHAICIKSSPHFPDGYGVGDRSTVFSTKHSLWSRLSPSATVQLRNET